MKNKKTRYCLDTNYLLRYIVDDIPEQTDEVVNIFDLASEGKVECFVSITAQMEIFYVLSSFYEYDKKEVCVAMTNIYNMVFLDFEYVEIMEEVLDLYLQKNISIQDAFLIIFSKKNNMEFKTFDKKASKLFSVL